MIYFFQISKTRFYVLQSAKTLIECDLTKLRWLFSDAQYLQNETIEGFFVGPRREMLTPWSTNAVEITQNMGIEGIQRIEQFEGVEGQHHTYDKMLEQMYVNLTQDIFTIERKPDEIVYIDDIQAYNQKEGLALNSEEVEYLNEVSKKIGRQLTDSEVFGFSQVNSEHCRHKIFNGNFVIDDVEMEFTLFQLIKKTSKENPNSIVSAYHDNVAFLKGPEIEQFAPKTQDKPDFFETKTINSILSLKAETHNFPTTVEPFNGASTGSGGEIRDRMAGGKGSFPLAGTVVYMTSYPRNDQNKTWEDKFPSRTWLYQTPEEILIKASNGASDFGNKFGQPLICGSLLTFEYAERDKKIGFDKVIMLAGGVGYGNERDTHKDTPNQHDKIVVLGGDNYRIGMGGGAVSSVATGEYHSGIELNAVQRANPEMQKRAYNVIRAMAESNSNPIISVHDHGAGGHLNALSELVAETGGTIHLDKLPIGDPTLSSKEIIGNESQERMGLVLNEKHVELMRRVAERERSPMYVVGDVTGDMNFQFIEKQGNSPIDLKLDQLFGKTPKTFIKDKTNNLNFKPLVYDSKKYAEYLELVLQLESVGCKDWLTNKVDRSVTGKIAMQQCAGEIQLPLNNLGVVALDYTGTKGIATSFGHAPAAGLIDAKAGSVLAVAEALTNLVWALTDKGLESVSLSANWMWPCKNEGEDARLYEAVEAMSNFAIDLGINIPTGKDSLSMTQKYPNGETVMAPGTVIVSAVAEVKDVRKTVSPVMVNDLNTYFLHIDFSKDTRKLGGSAFAQVINQLGNETPSVCDADYFKKCFNAVQYLIENDKILAGHDISAGGMITTLFEMTFANENGGIYFDTNKLEKKDLVKALFCENPGVIIQVRDFDYVIDYLLKAGIKICLVGLPVKFRSLILQVNEEKVVLEIDQMLDYWYKPSYLLDRKQSGETMALKRYFNFRKQSLSFNFPDEFPCLQSDFERFRAIKNKPKAAILREKGVNGDREMAYSLYAAGFDVKDVHVTDLISGRETLDEIQMLVFVGGFSNSDVFGSGKGWAGALLYNEKANAALQRFYQRTDTLSLGVCNGCQLMMELGLLYPEHAQKPKMLHNESQKFESAFLTVNILKTNSIMLKKLEDTRLGIWVAHGEGKFLLPLQEYDYQIAMKYAFDEYPANPNGSDYAAAALVSADGRHLAMMPHLERAIFPWQWAHYITEYKQDKFSPWIQAFVSAREWIEKFQNK